MLGIWLGSLFVPSFLDKTNSYVECIFLRLNVHMTSKLHRLSTGEVSCLSITNSTYLKYKQTCNLL